MADILINGMEMPKDIGSITVTIYSDGSTGIWTEQEMISGGMAIELPPHGRLIDALHLYMDIKSYFCDSAICVAKKNGIECVHCNIETVLDNIERRKTIVEANNGNNN